MQKMSEESTNKLVMPMLVMNWIFGIGIIEYPKGRQHFIVSFLYSTSCLIVYCYLSWYSYPYILQITQEYDISEKIIKILFYSHVFIIITSIVTGWSRNQGMRSIIKHLENSDNLLEQIGVPKMYSKKFKIQLLKYVFALLCILVIASINSSIMLINKPTLEYGEVIATFVINYPIIMMFIVDSTFINLVKSGNDKLKALNMTLRKLLTSTKDNPQHAKIVRLYWQTERERSHVNHSNRIEEDATFTLNTAMKAHLSLLKLYREINETFGLHMLLSIVISIGIMTGSLYNEIEVLFQKARNTESHIYRVSLHSALWISHYCIKLFILCYVCSHAVEESIVTGDIISEVYDEPFIGEEAQAQIREFHFNLINNDISFNAKGFVKLDFTLIQVVIGAISTYLMVLTQFENIIFPTCSNSTCI